MKVKWHVSGGASASLAADLSAIGIKTDEMNSFSFSMMSTDPRWESVQSLFATSPDVIRLPTTVFERSELEAATSLYVARTWFWAYPQPEDDYPSPRTFDLSEYCDDCGAGARQIAPFLVKTEPKWGRRSFLTLYWVYGGALFVRPDVWEERLRPLGIGVLPVLHKSGRELPGVVQIQIDEEVPIDTRALEWVQCEHCARRRYIWPTDRFPPPTLGDPRREVFRSVEWFGPGGHAATQVVGCSSTFYSAVKDFEGLRFERVFAGSTPRAA